MFLRAVKGFKRLHKDFKDLSETIGTINQTNTPKPNGEPCVKFVYSNQLFKLLKLYDMTSHLRVIQAFKWQ